jgi:hypothetical protein
VYSTEGADPCRGQGGKVSMTEKWLSHAEGYKDVTGIVHA